MKVRTLDSFDFHHTLAHTPGAALVYFTAPGCGACKALRSALKQLSAAWPDLRIFEVDAQRDGALVREFEVFHLPSLFLYKEGNYHAALHCAPLPGELQATIEHSLVQPAQEAP